MPEASTLISLDIQGMEHAASAACVMNATRWAFSSLNAGSSLFLVFVLVDLDDSLAFLVMEPHESGNPALALVTSYEADTIENLVLELAFANADLGLAKVQELYEQL